MQNTAEIVSGEEAIAGSPSLVVHEFGGRKVADAAEVRILEMTGKDLFGRRLGKVSLADDSVREARAIRLRLRPHRLGNWVVDPNRRLHVDDLAHVLKACLGDVLIG